MTDHFKPIGPNGIENAECVLRRFEKDIQVVTPCGILMTGADDSKYANRMLYALADSLLRAHDR